MSNIHQPASCDERLSAESHPVNPFDALRIHFGMLLGVDDFETLQGHALGKQRLHNAWAHRAGVLWGFGVTADAARGEIRVRPGLALDAAGHELHLDGDACLDVAAWFRAHEQDPELQVTRVGDSLRFDAHVVVRYASCLAREVPALSEPCAGAQGGTVYSRLHETVELRLLPGLAETQPAPYPRLRLLFGLQPPREQGGMVIPADQEVLDRRSAILALTDPAQVPPAYLEAFRDFAAKDVIEMAPVADPASGPLPLFPGPERADVVLANLEDIALDASGGGLAFVGVGEIDETVRPAHVATATIQELLCGPLFAALAAAPAGPSPSPTDPAASPASPSSGPRVVRSSVALNKKVITFEVDKPLHGATVHRDAFTVSVLREGAQGWNKAVVNDASFASEGGVHTVKVELDKLPAGDHVRFVARGTGPTPLLGQDLAPLVGAVGEPFALTPHDGRDFIAMLPRKS